MEKASVSDDSPDSSADCDWSQLQTDLLLQIFGILEIPDLFSSGVVCRSWHLIYLEARRLRRCSPNQSPCLVYSPGNRDANTVTLHNMSTNKLYHVTLSEPAFCTRHVMGSSYGWLITADERSNLILVNPVTRAQITMPPPETMNNVRLRYTEEGVLDGYDVLYMDLFSRDFDNEMEPYHLTLEEARFYLYARVVLSCDPSHGNCTVLVVQLPKDQLSYTRVGDTKWTWIDANPNCRAYQDILYNSNDGLFYGVRGRGQVDTINLNGPSAEVKVILKPIISYQAHSRYIVQAPWGDFFQIWRHDKYNKENGRKDRVADKFFVYKIDFVEQKLVQTNNIQDHAMFIGYNSSFMLPVKDFSTLIPNSIYHTDDLLHYIFCHRFGLRQAVVFNMKDSSFIELSPPSSDSRLNWPPSVWIQPSLT
ncbi:F-box only protein 7-like [Triticum dicoccoides]|uniref:F-box only protein 7-like n=1 Tax=Triticum dicoccoides TaxID=85692 RepID=UPI000E798A83|nr:F-box only protein 7-like [Triticum dicoccoides]XP_037412012.1 F-box only protein 7-like [Triticum dicoccoides]